MCLCVCVCVRVRGCYVGCRDGPLTENTLKHSHLPSVCRIASLKPHLFCLLSVSVFSFFSVPPQPILKKKKIPSHMETEAFKPTTAASCFRSSGTCGVWTWTKRWRLSTPCRRGPWHSHSAGRVPSRECLSSSAWCTLLPASAPVCRFLSRNGGRSNSRPSNQKNASTGHPHDLEEESNKNI